jgi:hypothetical protein
MFAHVLVLRFHSSKPGRVLVLHCCAIKHMLTAVQAAVRSVYIRKRSAALAFYGLQGMARGARNLHAAYHHES